MAGSHATNRVGVFGGTFDPIHVGHVAVARAAQHALSLDEVLFVVNFDQWIRENPPVASASDRLRMVELAVEGVPGLAASDVDIVRGGSTYTIDTLADLHRELGSTTEMYLIVGADSAASMDRWRRGDEIKDFANIVAVGRPGQKFSTESLESSHPASGAEYVEGPMNDISATRVRELLKAGEPVDAYVPAGVVEYIESQSLYR